MPPGRLMLERGKFPSRGAAMSTFHRLDCTSTILPTTRSPISGVYLARRGMTDKSLFVFRTVPKTALRMVVEFVGL